jgi:hypothetical protein
MAIITPQQRDANIVSGDLAKKRRTYAANPTAAKWQGSMNLAYPADEHRHYM